MKKILLIAMLLLAGSTLVQAAAFEKDAKFRATKVHISADKPLTTGSNTFVLDIKAKNIEGATVKVKAFMPAMPGMPAMQSIAKAKSLGDGKYKVKLNISMSGTWQLHIFISPKHGKKMRVKTSINF